MNRERERGKRWRGKVIAGLSNGRHQSRFFRSNIKWRASGGEGGGDLLLVSISKDSWKERVSVLSVISGGKK